MMIIDEDLIGSLQRLFVEKPLRGVAQHLHRDSLGTVPHGRDAQVGAVRDESSQQNILVGRCVFFGRSQSFGEVAPHVHLPEQVLDPHLLERGFKDVPQLLGAVWNFECVGTLELKCPLCTEANGFAERPSRACPATRSSSSSRCCNTGCASDGSERRAYPCSRSPL